MIGSFEERIAASLATLRVLVILLGIGLLIATGFAAYGFARANNAIDEAGAAARAQAATAHAQARLTRQVAAAALAQSTQAQAVAKAVNEERLQTLNSFCVAQNERNAATIRQLQGEIAQGAKRAPRLLATLFRLVGIRIGPRASRTLGRWQAQQSQASYRSTVALINDLAPEQNCARVVAAGTVR